MMRKAVIALLALLVIAGCAPPPEGTPEPAETLSPSPMPSEPPPSPTYVVVLPDGIPEKPDYDLGEIGARWYPEHVPALRPRSDYGRLYPFIGTEVGELWFYKRPMFGLCTADGRIVIDPVYVNVEIAERDGKAIYLLQTLVRSGYNEGRMETTVAALDGSWAATYQQIDRLAAGGDRFWMHAPPDPETISVYDGAGWGAIGYDGTLVYPCKERFPVHFCDGLAVIWSEDGRSCFYIDTQGRAVIGPLEAPEPMGVTSPNWRAADQNLYFSHGLARFMREGLWGYIDTKGTVAVEPQYRSAFCYFGQYGVASVQRENVNIYSVLDRSGNVLTEAREIGPIDEDLYIAVYLEGEIVRKLMNGKGEVVPMTITPERILENGWFAEQKGAGTRLEKDGEVIEFPREILIGLSGDRFLYFSDPSWSVVDKTGAYLLEGQAGWPQLLPSGRIRSGYQKVGLWDADLTPLLPAEYREIFEYGDYYAVRAEKYCGLTDDRGNWVVRRSLLDTAVD